MVGGFAANDWLFSKVEEGLKPNGITVIRPENHVYDPLLFSPTRDSPNDLVVETKPYQMELSLSISTTMSRPESQSSRMANSELPSTTRRTSTM